MKHRALLAIGLVLFVASPSYADTYSNSFALGPGNDFAVGWTPGSEVLWTIDTNGPTLRISKPADDGSVLGTEIIGAFYIPIRWPAPTSASNRLF